MRSGQGDPVTSMIGACKTWVAKVKREDASVGALVVSSKLRPPGKTLLIKLLKFLKVV